MTEAPRLRVIALGTFRGPLPPLAPRLQALGAQALRASSLAQLPAAPKRGDILLAELDWLPTLPADDAVRLGRFAANAAAWVMLADTAAGFKERIAWQRRGVTHCFDRPLDPERLAALVEDVHDRLYGPPLKVVLVDDDAASLALYGEMLRRAGCEVLPTADPLLVLDTLDELHPDVLLVDIEMPACRGPEFVALVRQRAASARLPAIYLTAMDSLEDKLHARSAAAEDFLAKPVEARLLIASVETQGRRYRAWQREQTQAYAAQARERLKAEQLRQAVDAHATVSIADVKGNIVEVNDQFCAISGYTRAELIGRNHRIVKSDQHPPEFYRALWRTIAAGQIWHGELCNRRKDGGLHWVAATIVPICDSRGTPQQYISIRTDITRIKAQKRALIVARETAEAANRAKSEFLSSMSHELRTPMNAILGFAQMLETDHELSADQKDSVHEIVKAGKHLLGLINEVLDLAKIEAGRIDLSMEGLSVRALAEECALSVAPLAARRGIRITIDATGELAVFADRNRLRQVLLNLLSNAVKYNREGGQVRLTAHVAENGRVHIAVRDTGPGIAADKLPLLFQPFNRLGQEGSNIEGTGIGLTITRRLIELMGGTVGVESAPGEGSTFWVELAAATETKVSADGTARGKTPAATVIGQGATLLAIDDNPTNLKLLAQMIGRVCPQAHLITAHNAELGLELARARHPDLILLDIGMPGMDGLELLALMKADERLESIPAIAVTAHAMPHDIERGRAAGFADYLTKPLDFDTLRASLIRHLPTAKESA